MLLFAILFAVATQSADAQVQNRSLTMPRGLLADSADAITALGLATDVRRHRFDASPAYLPSRAAPQRRREARVAKTALADADIGDTLSFNTPNVISGAWTPTNFTLVAESDTARLWVATSELLAGEVDQTDIDALTETLNQSTPPASLEPSNGILEINTEIYGDPANYDGDGVIDILWHDIRDAYLGPGNAFTPFVVAADDIDPAAEEGVGNQADVLYLDTFPTLTGPDHGIDVVRANAAAGHQALIHMNHDPNEIFFLRNGLIESAKVLNGFGTLERDYLASPLEHNIAFLSFDGFEGDYQRSALFMRYVVDQLGVEALGFLTRDSSNAADGLEHMLASTNSDVSLSTIVADFHLANLVSDQTIDPRFGYSDPELQSIVVTPTVKYDGSLATQGSLGTATIQPGAVVYLRWENVSDLAITIDTDDVAERDLFTVRAVLDRAHAPSVPQDIEIRDVVMSGSATVFTGPNESVTIVLVHADLSADGVPVSLAATWSDTAFPTTNIVQDGGTIADTPWNFITLGPDFTQAVRFEKPSGSALRKVYVDPLFRNQFIDPATELLFGEPTLPRSLTLYVFGDDGFGFPGDTLLTTIVVDSRAWSPAVGFDLSFLEVDLRDHGGLALENDVVYVAVTEDGSDPNFLMLAASVYDVQDTSFLWGPIPASDPPEWHRLWKLMAGAESLSGFSFPIRAQFQSTKPVSIEPIAGIDESSLVFNAVYPTPSNDVAHVAFTTGTATKVQVAVYDLLGRRVATISESSAGVGPRELEIDVGGFASGVYILSIQHPNASRTHPLVVRH